MKYNDKWAISEFEPKTDVLWVQPGQDEGDESVKINAFVNGKWRVVSDGEKYPPEGGIPVTDLDGDVQSSLSKADTAYQKPTTGIPPSDLASGVQTSLDKADTALQTIKTVNGQSLVGSGDIEILEPGTIETLVIDNTPTAGSSNLITSGGVASEIVWDVTARNSNATFASLSALLSANNLSTLIPTSVRKGGMQIRFVQSSDNKYVQYRLMATSFSTTESEWQGVDDVPTADSDNLVKSGGVFGYYEDICQKTTVHDYTSNLISGYAINVGNYSVGQTVDTSLASNSVIACELISVYKNSVFKLTGSGATTPRLWALLDKDKKLLSMANAGATSTDLIINIEEDGYLVINVRITDAKSIKTIPMFASEAELSNFEASINSTISSLPKDVSFYDSPACWFISKTDGSLKRNVSLDSSKCTTKFLPVHAGIKIFGSTGSAHTACAFYDEGLNFISAITSGTGDNVLTTLSAGDIPSNAVYFRSTGMTGCYIEGLTNNDLLASSANYTRALFGENGFNPVLCNYRDGYTIATNVAVGETVDVSTLSTNAQFVCAVARVKKGDIIRFSGYGATTYRLLALTDNNFKLKYKTNTITYYAETLYVENDGYAIINARKEDGYHFYVNGNDKNILPFKRARWIAMGDSITQGYYSYEDSSALLPQKCWAHIVAAINQYNLTNAGVGGQGYMDDADGNATDLVQTLDFSDYDLVTLAYGINDFKGSQPLGSMSDTVSDKESVVACMRFVIETIIDSNPNIKIIVITPVNCRGYSTNRIGDETTNYAIGTQVNGKTLDDFFDAFVEVCEYYGIEYIDMTHSSIINRLNAETTLPDGVHPSITAHLMMGRELAKKINLY